MVLSAQVSWFGTVVSIADTVQGLLHQNARFPRSLLVDAYRLRCMKRRFYPLARKVRLDPDHRGEDDVAATTTTTTTAKKTAGMLVGGLGVSTGAGPGSWTLELWLYLDEDSTGQMRTVFHSGLDQEAVRQALFVGANDRKLVLTISTQTDWRESCTSRNEVPLKAWTHVACRCDMKTRTASIFVNGESNGEARLSSDPKVCRHPLFLGSPPEGAMAAASPPIRCVQGVVKRARLHIRALPDDVIAASHDLSRASAEEDDDDDDDSYDYDESAKMAMDVQQGDAAANRPRGGTTLSRKELERFLAEHASPEGWGLERLFQISELGITHCEETKQSPLHLDVDTLEPKEEELLRLPLLRDLSTEDIRFRFSVIQLFNRQLEVMLPLVDLSQTHLPWSLAHSICRLTPLVFTETKLGLWNSVLNSTMSASLNRPSITINRPRAMRAHERGDPDGEKSVFGQAFRQLHFEKPENLRTTGQLWRVTYEGEGGTDAGGLFRDSISHICSDLQSDYVPLFIPCPNSKGIGENQDKWIPNPSCTTSLHLSMYAFVGKLMGVAIRSKHYLNLDLPSMVWKQLVGAEPDLRDLEGIDRHCYNSLVRIASMTKEKDDDEGDRQEWEATAYTWSTPSCDGRTVVDLVPGGRDIPVAWEARDDYRRAVERFRLNEFKLQTEHMRKGMATIVPVQLLSLFTWQELELNVCGRGKIDVDFLRENTSYQSGFSAEDQHVQMLWEVLRGFTHKQRELFLRFVWGRSRLPISSADFSQKFVILSCRHNTDGTLPVSHTCFFQLELPRYSSARVLREKLLYAITECTAIDTDHRAGDLDWDAED